MKTPEQIADELFASHWDSLNSQQLMILAIETDRAQREEGEKTDPDTLKVGDMVILTGKDWEEEGLKDRIVMVADFDYDGGPIFYVPENGSSPLYIFDSEGIDYSATKVEGA